ncbi:BBE domain-containing protein [Ramlibacter sp.]
MAALPAHSTMRGASCWRLRPPSSSTPRKPRPPHVERAAPRQRANRDARYDCFPVSIWDARADDDVSIRWARDVWSAVRPFSAGGVHANNLGDEGEDRVRAAYGANHARLAALKAKYDPSNVFRLNQNVRPSSAPT